MCSRGNSDRCQFRRRKKMQDMLDKHYKKRGLVPPKFVLSKTMELVNKFFSQVSQVRELNLTTEINTIIKYHENQQKEDNEFLLKMGIKPKIDWDKELKKLVKEGK